MLGTKECAPVIATMVILLSLICGDLSPTFTERKNYNRFFPGSTFSVVIFSFSDSSMKGELVGNRGN